MTTPDNKTDDNSFDNPDGNKDDNTDDEPDGNPVDKLLGLSSGMRMGLFSYRKVCCVLYFSFSNNLSSWRY